MKKRFLSSFPSYPLSALLIWLIFPLCLCANHLTPFSPVSNEPLAPLKQKQEWRLFDFFLFQRFKQPFFAFERSIKQKQPDGTLLQIQLLGPEEDLLTFPLFLEKTKQKKKPSSLSFFEKKIDSFSIPMETEKNSFSSMHPKPQPVDFFLFHLPLNLKKVAQKKLLFFPSLKHPINGHLNLRPSESLRLFSNLQKTGLPPWALQKELSSFFAPLFSIQNKEKAPLFVNKSPCFATLPPFSIPSSYQDSFNEIPLNFQRLSFIPEGIEKRAPIKKKRFFFKSNPTFQQSLIKKKYRHFSSHFYVKPLILPLTVSQRFSSKSRFPSFNTDEMYLYSKQTFEREYEKNRVFPQYSLLAIDTSSPIEFPFALPILNRANRSTTTFLTQTLSPFFVQTIKYENALHPTIYYSKQADEPGYAFCIKIDAHKTISPFCRPQYFTFIIDRSSQIHTNRFTTFKEGTQKALAHLKEQDYFNILILDHAIIPLSPTPLPYNPTSIAKAKQFLIQENSKKGIVRPPSFDLFSSALEELPHGPEHYVILMTDGHFLQPTQHNGRHFSELIQKNRGHFSLFTAAASQGNELAILDLLSGFNKGALMHTKTNASFSRNLIFLIKQIQSLIAKDVEICAIQKEKEIPIQFHRNKKSFSPLYACSPYFIYGTIDELKDFDLIFQGCTKDHTWIHIKESISFKNALKAPSFIQKQMAYQKAHVHYDTFLKTYHPLALKKAQKILEETINTKSYRNR